MLEEQCVVTDLEKALKHSEGYIFNVHNYQSIQNALDADDDIQTHVVEKLLSFCVRQLNEDRKYTSIVLNLISTILKKKNKCSTLPDLVPSAVGVLHVLKTTALLSKVETLKTLCFDIILSYPDETLISLVVKQSNELLELINLYCHQRVPVAIKLQILDIIAKLLKILPPEKKSTFVQEGVDTWFSKIIPLVNFSSALSQVLKILEMLIDDLVLIEYTDNPHWRVILENIYTPQKFPAYMKNLLESHCEDWYRLWIILIKLLKSQITKSISNTGSPINSMLPIVEMAFKMDVHNRCKAFLCWNVLIDNFATETNEMYVNKRIKLLVIPLTSNNAKVEDTALVKFNTWWHLICNYYLHMDKVSNTVLIPFLYFCFGKPISEKPVLVPGMLSEKTKAQCVQGFININGHMNCEGCVNLPKLKNKLLTTKILVDHWKEWIHFLKSALKVCAENEQFTNKQIACFWMSFIKTIGELPENYVRRDLFMEVIGIFDNFEAMTGCKKRLYDIIFKVLIVSLLDDKETQPLMKTKDCKYSPILRIVKMVLKLQINYEESSEVVNNFKPITMYVVKEALDTSSHSIEFIVKDLLSNNLLFWVALADSIQANYYNICERVLHKMIIWPLKHLELFTKETIATSCWNKLYEFAYNKLLKDKVNEDIFSILMSHTSSAKYNKFIINAAIVVAQKKIDSAEEPFENELEWLLKSLTKINIYEDIENVFPILSSLIASVMERLCKEKDTTTAERVVFIVKHVLMLHKQSEGNDIKEDSHNYVKGILINLSTFFNVKEYGNLMKLLLDEFKELCIGQNIDTLRDRIFEILNIKDNDPDVKEAIKLLKEKCGTKSNAGKQSKETKFTTPSGKPSAKKPKKKDVSIVNTVVEDGEEYVVVKSNWKFNPRKLTDNQKEKFQRKREDIPALYQDLSQSQDDFKLNTWKTDSQDTTTASKSASETGNEDMSAILKNIPNTEFVPKILENIIKENANDVKSTVSEENTNVLSKTDDKNDASKLQTTKTPRLPLKDRVFKNFKSLMEKSNVNNKNYTAIPNVSEKGSKTPTTKLITQSHVTNSAPTSISADRPSRLKRKPKKFQDLQIFGLKKRRHSLGQNDTNTEGESSDGNSTDSNTSVPIKVAKYMENKNNNDVHEKIKDKETTLESEVIAIPETNETSNSVEPKDDWELKDPSIESNEKEVTDTSVTASADKIGLNETQIDDISTTSKIVSEQVPEKNDETLSTPRSDKNRSTVIQKSSKKPKKSRIENELAIDMVEGHPFLNTSHRQKRLTRKAILKEKANLKNESKSTPKNEKRNSNEKDKSVSIKKSQNSTADILESQDVIESSQESAITPISVKSIKTPNKVLVVALSDINQTSKGVLSLINGAAGSDISSKDDVELSCNKTAEDNVIDLTESVDTESISHNLDVIVVNDEDNQSKNKTEDKSDDDMGMGNTAEAVTQTLDSQMFANDRENDNINIDISASNSTNDTQNTDIADDVTETMTESGLEKDYPFTDEEQRKVDFMNNTYEISPIKTMSPVREDKAPPENNDYVVIKLSSPVQGNGEPFEKCESPEIFTEEKSPPRDQSPVREECTAVNTSPISSLSLKKNRPQVRSNGRAAQMLGLCVPDRRLDEDKKSPSVNSSARRNLRIMYSSNTESESVDENEDNDNFLKLKRILPSTECSPSGPILKRKLSEIADETTASPAGKRKRVSFHDPPVSTTICVNKYIEPCGLRSPQNSAIKRQERLLRTQLPMKSPKRLENVFNLDSILTKTVESFFSDLSSLGTAMAPETSVAEIVKISKLNDTEPLCSKLVDCKDPISNIASDLSSLVMEMLLVKEFEGKVGTVGDLAKLTELEVNSLCIKTPKVQAVRKVLNAYLNRSETCDNDNQDKKLVEYASENKSVEVQTNVLVEDMAMQTEELVIQTSTTQTNLPLYTTCGVQTDKVEMESTENIVSTCYKERPDFIEKLCDKMDDDAKLRISSKLSFDTLIGALMDKMTPSNSQRLLNRVIEEQSKHIPASESSDDRKLCVIKDYLCDNLETKDLVLFCSDILKRAYEDF